MPMTTHVHENAEEIFGGRHKPRLEDETTDHQKIPVAAVKRVIKLLLMLNMPQVVERETWESPVWTLFSDG